MSECGLCGCTMAGRHEEHAAEVASLRTRAEQAERERDDNLANGNAILDTLERERVRCRALEEALRRYTGPATGNEPVAERDALLAMNEESESRVRALYEALREVAHRASLPITPNVTGTPDSPATVEAAIERCGRLLAAHIAEPALAALAEHWGAKGIAPRPARPGEYDTWCREQTAGPCANCGHSIDAHPVDAGCPGGGCPIFVTREP